MTGEAQPGRMRTLLEHVARALVDDPSAVVVTEEQDGDFTKLHLQVAEPDVGKVIGRGGRIAKGIRAETPEGEPLGSVREVLRAGETDVLVIRPEGSGPDLLVPAIASVVREVDVPDGRVVIAPQEVL